MSREFTLNNISHRFIMLVNISYFSVSMVSGSDEEDRGGDERGSETEREGDSASAAGGDI